MQRFCTYTPAATPSRLSFFTEPWFRVCRHSIAEYFLGLTILDLQFRWFMQYETDLRVQKYVNLTLLFHFFRSDVNFHVPN